MKTNFVFNKKMNKIKLLDNGEIINLSDDTVVDMKFIVDKLMSVETLKKLLLNKEFSLLNKQFVPLIKKDEESDFIEIYNVDINNFIENYLFDENNYFVIDIDKLLEDLKVVDNDGNLVMKYYTLVDLDNFSIKELEEDFYCNDKKEKEEVVAKEKQYNEIEVEEPILEETEEVLPISDDLTLVKEMCDEIDIVDGNNKPIMKSKDMNIDFSKITRL